MNDYPRFYALSGLGFGRGNTPGEAIEAYVAAQLRTPASSTIFKTRAKWEAALRTGEAKADVWLVPEGTFGHVQGAGLKWLSEDEYGTTIYTSAKANELLDHGEEHATRYREVEVVTVTQPRGEEGAAYRLTLPDGKQVVIGDGQDAYGDLARIIDDAFEAVNA